MIEELLKEPFKQLATINAKLDLVIMEIAEIKARELHKNPGHVLNDMEARLNNIKSDLRDRVNEANDINEDPIQLFFRLIVSARKT